MASNFVDFKVAIQEHETLTNTKYIVSYNSKNFLAEVNLSRKRLKILWDDGIPFISLGSRMYECHLGPDSNIYQKKKCSEKGLSSEKKVTTKLRTKKLDCPACFLVRRVYWMKDYEIPIRSKYYKDKYSTMIKKILAKPDTPNGEVLYRIKFPDVSDHENHDVGQKDAKTLIVGERCSLSPESDIIFYPSTSKKNEMCEKARKKLINGCKAKLRSIEALTKQLTSDYLPEFRKKLHNLCKEMRPYVKKKEGSTRPAEEDGSDESIIFEEVPDIEYVNVELGKTSEDHHPLRKRRIVDEKDQELADGVSPGSKKKLVYIYI